MKYRPEENDLFNAILLYDPHKGKIAIGCPCRCTGKIYGGGISAIDSDGAKRIFMAREFSFDFISRKQKSSGVQESIAQS